MRLLIVGSLKGQLTTATKLAMQKGASVTHAESSDQAMAVLRSGKGADLLMVDVALDIRDLVLRLEAERIHVPLVACGTQNDARAAVAAIHAGAKEYIPLPPDPDMIAAVLAAVADDTRHPGAGDRSRRRQPSGARGHPHHRNLEPRSRGSGARRHVPRGSAFPAQRGEPQDPGPARASGRCAGARPAFRQALRGGERPAGAAAVERGQAPAHAGALAGQRARAREYDPPRRADGE